MLDAPKYEELYVENYDLNNSKVTLSGKMLQKSHALLEGMLPRNFSAEKVLEVGAGSGHHYRHVNQDVGEYYLTDGSEEMLKMARRHFDKELINGRLKIEKQNAVALTYPDGMFDRLIATHVLEHIINPVEALREWNRVVKKGGVISIVLPCDPGLLWRIGRYLGPRKNALKMGLPYDYLQAAEHVNSIFNLRTFIKFHFENISERWYPINLPLPDLNLFYICHIQK